MVIDGGGGADGAATSTVGHIRRQVVPVRQVIAVGCGPAYEAGLIRMLLADDRRLRPDGSVVSFGLRCQVLLEFFGSNVQTISQFADRQIFLDMQQQKTALLVKYYDTKVTKV